MATSPIRVWLQTPEKLLREAAMKYQGASELLVLHKGLIWKHIFNICDKNYKGTTDQEQTETTWNGYF